MVDLYLAGSRAGPCPGYPGLGSTDLPASNQTLGHGTLGLGSTRAGSAEPRPSPCPVGLGSTPARPAEPSPDPGPVGLGSTLTDHRPKGTSCAFMGTRE
jgi:hypothetical protein